MEQWVAWVLLGYVLLQLGVAAFVARRIRNETDYLIAGRSLGVAVTAMSLFATWFGAETIMASSGAIAQSGLAGGRAEPFGYALCLLLVGLLLAGRMRAHNFLTSGDYYRERFGPATEKLGVAVQVLSSTVWAAAQVLAFGHIIANVLGLELDTAILFGLIVVCIYTTLGGLLGDVISDCVQGVMLVVGLGVTLFALVATLGGWEHAFGTLSLERLNFIRADEPLALQCDQWAIAILGSMTAQEVMSRILATRSPQVARKASFCAAGLYLLVALIPVTIGLLGAAVLPVTGENSDSYMPQLARTMLPVPLYVVFLGALISAILSTIDSTLLSISGLIGRNIVEPLRTDLSEKAKLRLQRGLTLTAAVVVYFVATGGDSIYSLIQTTSSFGAAGILVVMLAGLWTRRGGPRTGFCTVLAGIVFTVLAQLVLELEAAFLISLAGCVAVYAAGAWLERRERTRSLPDCSMR